MIFNQRRVPTDNFVEYPIADFVVDSLGKLNWNIASEYLVFETFLSFKFKMLFHFKSLFREMEKMARTAIVCHNWAFAELKTFRTNI